MKWNEGAPPAIGWWPASSIGAENCWRWRGVMMDWECTERLPRFEDRFDFEVWDGEGVRSVRRANNRSSFCGTLLYTDCFHPLQNIICDESRIQAWRIKSGAGEDGG